MRTCFLLLVAPVLFVSLAHADADDLSGGVLLVHAPPGVVYTSGTIAWCDSTHLTDCEDQVNTIAANTEAVWFVLSAWAEEKSFSAVEFGLNDFDPESFIFMADGVCLDDAMAIHYPSVEDWPGPNTGIALAANGDAWTGQLVPIAWFAGYSYAQADTIPLVGMQSTGHAGWVSGESRTTYDAECLGVLGLGVDGTACCPEGTEAGSRSDALDRDDMPDDRHMHLNLKRWRAPSYVDVLLGHVDYDANIDRDAVKQLIEDASFDWTRHFDEAVYFHVINQGDDLYEIADDGVSTVNWEPISGGTGSYGGTYAQLDIFNDCPQRIIDVDIRFYEYLGSHNLCWVDCSEAYGFCSPDGNAYNIDIATLARHEWGHGAAGLGHYSPANFSASIMSSPWEEPPWCRDRNLGPVDIEYAQWIYEGIGFDDNEPANDCWPTGTDLGTLYGGDQVDNGWRDALPGYMDIDIFQFDVPYVQDLWILEFTVLNGGDPGAQYSLTARCNGEFRFEYSAFTGEDVRYQAEPEVGLWQVLVRTASIPCAPSPYGFSVWLGGMPVGVSEEGGSAPKTDLHLEVDPITRLAWGAPLERDGTLKLFDAAGREVWSRDIRAGSSWSMVVDAVVPSGVYFLRLSDELRSTARRFVVVK